jgi:hypothetical protein
VGRGRASRRRPSQSAFGAASNRLRLTQFRPENSRPGADGDKLSRACGLTVVNGQLCPARGSASTSRQEWRGTNPRRSRALSMA